MSNIQTPQGTPPKPPAIKKQAGLTEIDNGWIVNLGNPVPGLPPQNYFAKDLKEAIKMLEDKLK